VTEDSITKLKQKIQENKRSLNIARLPQKTKEEFMKLANEEFCGDYGMALREILNCYFEHHSMKSVFFQNIDMKLDSILESISQPEQKEEEPDAKEIKMVSGKRIEVKGGKNKDG